MGGQAELTADLDWRQTGEQSWNIDVETADGLILQLAPRRNGTLCGRQAHHIFAASEEYEGIYAHFAELLRTGRPHVDGAPLQLVSDCFMMGRRTETEALRLSGLASPRRFRRHPRAASRGDQGRRRAACRRPPRGVGRIALARRDAGFQDFGRCFEPDAGEMRLAAAGHFRGERRSPSSREDGIQHHRMAGRQRPFGAFEAGGIDARRRPRECNFRAAGARFRHACQHLAFHVAAHMDGAGCRAERRARCSRPLSTCRCPRGRRCTAA